MILKLIQQAIIDYFWCESFWVLFRFLIILALFLGLAGNEVKSEIKPATSYRTNDSSEFWGTIVNALHPAANSLISNRSDLVRDLDLIPNFNATMVPRAGYHSEKFKESPNEVWAQVDLGSVQKIDAIALVPAFIQEDQKSYEGYGFPERFKIEVSDTEDFANIRTVIDERFKNFPNPGKYPVIYQREASGRYVRFTATKLYNFKGEQLLALSEIMVISQGQNIALWCPVQGSHNTNLYFRWSAVNLTDNISYLPIPTTNQPSSTYGFRYVIVDKNNPLELFIDLGKVMPVDAITIYPAVHQSLPSTPGLGMPGRFEILVSEDAEFKNEEYFCRFLNTNLNHWLDLPLSYSSKTRYKFSGKQELMTASFPGKKLLGRYIRITITECDSRANLLAFSEIEVVSNFRNVAPQATFTFSEPLSKNPDGWDIDYLKDGYTSLYKITNLSDWFLMIQQRRVIESQLLLIEDQLQRASEQVYWGLMVCVLGCTGGGFYIYVSALKRKNQETKVALLKLRQDLAADLHDDIGSNLSSINLLVENFLVDHQQDMSVDELARLKEVSLIARETAEAMRDVLWLVKHQERTLVVFLQHLKNVYLRVPGSFETQFVITGIVPEMSLDFEWQRDMYLVVKELLNNSLRHSHGNQVGCLVECGDQRIVFKLHDNGRLTDEMKFQQGHGIMNAMERVARQGGLMQINRGENLLEIFIDVPLKGQLNKTNIINLKPINEASPVDYLHEKTTAGEKVIV